MRRPICLASLVGLVVLASCNGDDDVSAPTTIGTTSSTAPDTTSASGTTPEHGPDPDCLYRRDVVLVQGDKPDEVPADLDELDPAELAELLRLQDDNDVNNLEQLLETEVLTAYGVRNGADPRQQAELLETRQGVEASPVLAATVTGHWSFAPGADPDDETSAKPEPPAGFDPTVTVAVVDTGYSEVTDAPDGTPEWLAQRVDPVDAIRDAEPPGLPDRVLGHGKFVASIIAQEAPTAAIHVAGMSNVPPGIFYGEELPPLIDEGFVSDELQLYLGVARLLDTRERYAALNLSVGSYGCPGLDLAADDEVTKTTGEGAVPERESGFAILGAVNAWNSATAGGAVPAPILAAAGNHDPSQPEPGIPFLPAAYAADPSSNVIGVASNDAHGGPLSDFSNSADTTAVGRDLVGVRLDGGGWTSWSGSSFATAVATGAVAATGPFPVPADLPLVRTIQG